MSSQEKPTAAFVVSLIGGVIGLIVSFFFLISYAGIQFFSLFGFWVFFCSLLVFIGALMMNSHPEDAKTWGMIVVAFSIIGFGSILGMIGGILAIIWKPSQPLPPSKLRLSTVNVAFVAVFAALQAVLSLIPLSFTIGVSGQITMGLVGAALIGVLLGPMVGGIAVLIGSFIGIMLNPAGAIFGVLTVLTPFFGAIGAGSVKIKKGYVAGAIILVSLLVFYAHPFGREALFYPWLHMVAMIVAFSPLARLAGKSFDSLQPAKPILGIIVASFVGVMTDHITGSAIGIWYYSPFLTPNLWYAIAFVYPVERLVALTIATIVAIPLYSSLKRAKLLDLHRRASP